MLTKYIPLLVIILTVWIVLLVPFKIISYGYMPLDDALRHAAKAVSEKPWNQILVLRDDIKMDGHVGWHIVLRIIYKLTKWDTFSLVLFSVISLFILFSITGIALLRRPEAWLVALLITCIADMGLLARLFIGRPCIITMSAVLAMGLLWPRLRKKNYSYGAAVTLTLLIALSVWMHGGWYLFALPVACFFLAREWRAGLRITMAVIIGVAAGAVATGHPYLFLKQNLYLLIVKFSNNSMPRMLVSELQPFGGDFPFIIAIALVLMWRALRGAWNIKAIDNPVFMLAASSWMIGFFTARAWLDLGLPAIILWLAQEFQDFFENWMNYFSWKRVVLTVISLGVFYLAITNDSGSRWSNCHPSGYLSLDNPAHAPWLPEPGGILYSDDMGIFYTTFYKNPNASWRYILGYEATFMPKQDLDTFRNIQRNNGLCTCFEPWVKKMRPQDRLIILNPSDKAPEIPGLEWHHIPDVVWSGRLPKEQKKAADKK